MKNLKSDLEKKKPTNCSFSPNQWAMVDGKKVWGGLFYIVFRAFCLLIPPEFGQETDQLVKALRKEQPITNQDVQCRIEIHFWSDCHSSGLSMVTRFNDITSLHLHAFHRLFVPQFLHLHHMAQQSLCQSALVCASHRNILLQE